MADHIAASRILIVDDDPDMRDILCRTLRRAGFWNVSAITGPEGVVEVFLRERPELLIIDYKLPPSDGLRVMGMCREHEGATDHTPVIMLTGGDDPSIQRSALEAGVADFLRKGSEDTELILRVRNVLSAHQLFLEVSRQKTWLEEIVRLRTAELFQARRDVLERLAAALDSRDDITGEHTKRVGKLARMVAKELGSPPEFADAMEVAALLHDIGKIAVSDAILMKPGELTAEERKIMQGHCFLGARILQGSGEPVMNMAHEIALTHHENWDGTGYPQGLCGIDIPLSGRIVAVIDSYDAMTNDRPYRKRLNHEEAITELLRCKGSQFDPQVVDAFLTVTRSVVSSSPTQNLNVGEWLPQFNA
ncbi:MAG: HD domain-containing phosphohydrolase [Fimbriimonas sp.]